MSEEWDWTDEDPGKCPFCGEPWQLVRPGKSQDVCDCQDDSHVPNWRVRELEAERDDAIAECRRRKGWDQDIAHWRERAEDAEAERGRLRKENQQLRDEESVTMRGYREALEWYADESQHTPDYDRDETYFDEGRFCITPIQKDNGKRARTALSGGQREDEADLAESRAALKEAEEKGTKSLEDLQREIEHEEETRCPIPLEFRVCGNCTYWLRIAGDPDHGDCSNPKSLHFCQLAEGEAAVLRTNHCKVWEWDKLERDQETRCPPPDCGHGHVYPNPDGTKARCGGPGLCSKCALDQLEKDRREGKTHETPEAEDLIDMACKYKW